MKQSKTTPAKEQEKKHVPRWLQNELYELSMPYVDRVIEAYNKEGIGFSRFSLQSMGEQLISMGYFHAIPNPPEEKPKEQETKEGLHTQGEWKFNKHETGRYCGDIDCEIGLGANGIMNIRTIAIVLKNAGEVESQANAELIVKAVNERQALVDENKQLKGYQSYIAEKIYNGDDEMLTFNQWIEAGEPE